MRRGVAYNRLFTSETCNYLQLSLHVEVNTIIYQFNEFYPFSSVSAVVVADSNPSTAHCADVFAFTALFAFGPRFTLYKIDT